MKRTHSLCALALTILMMGSTQAHGSLIQWAYDWNATPPAVTAGGGSVSLTNESLHFAKGFSNIVATNLQVHSTATSTAPDTFSPGGGNYSLKLTLGDVTSGLTKFLTFTGQLQGSFALDSANVTNTFFSPTTQFVTIGNTLFTVTLNAYTPPGPGNQGNLGSIGDSVQAASVTHVGPAPEPSSMALAGFGLGLSGLAAWRRRRTAAKAMA